MPSVTEGRVATRRQRRLSRPLLWTVCAGVSAASLVALASRWHWFAELFSHFRLHYLLAQGLLFVVFLNTRRFAWLAATLVLAVPNAWYVMPYLLPLFAASTAAPPAAARPAIIALNLNYHGPDPAAAIAYLQASGAELLVLSEYTPAWHRLLATALTGWPHRVTLPREDPFGLAVYSVRPFREVEPLTLGVGNSENLRLRVQLDGRDYQLYALHLFPPTSRGRALARNRQLAALAERLAGPVGEPRILVGDFNLTPFSPYFSDFLAATGLRDARRADGLHVTWPTTPLPLWIAIDHCLADPDADVVRVRNGPDVGSDHFPLEILLAGAQ